VAGFRAGLGFLAPGSWTGSQIQKITYEKGGKNEKKNGKKMGSQMIAWVRRWSHGFADDRMGSQMIACENGGKMGSGMIEFWKKRRQKWTKMDKNGPSSQITKSHVK
jgi:hypothetical protein